MVFSMRTHLDWRSPMSTASWRRKIDQSTAANTAHTATSGPSPSMPCRPSAPPSATNARLSSTDVRMTAPYDTRMSRRVCLPARGRKRVIPPPNPSWAMPDINSSVEMTAVLEPTVAEG